MSAHQYGRGQSYEDYRPQMRGDDRSGRMYENNYSSSYSRDRYQRSPSPRRRYSSPSHDQNRASHSGDDFEIRGASTRKDSGNTDSREDERNHGGYRREQSPSLRGTARRLYRDRDREGYRSPSCGSRSRSRSRSQSRNRRDQSRHYGSPPSREVIMEGLLPDMTEEDVRHPHQKTPHPQTTSYKCYDIVEQTRSISRELKQNYHVERLEDVRVIRDRQTKVSRGFGFLRFPSIEDSRAFVEHNYPIIHLHKSGSAENDGQAAQVRISFSRERDDRSRGEKAEGEWTCKICTFLNFASRTRCHRCQTPQIDMGAFGAPATAKPQYLNSGDSDAAPNGAPSQFLLIRALEPTVTEDLLAKGVAKLYKPGKRSSPPANAPSKKSNAKVASTTGDANLGAKEGSLRRVLLIRDRRSNESWRYGFAEFASIDDAQAALIRYNSFEKFTISSKPVTADYVHAGVFVPVLNAVEDLQRFTFSPLGKSATKLVYWDEEAWASELVVSAGSPRFDPSKHDSRTAADEAAAAAENEGLLKPGKEAEAKVKKRKAEATAAAKQKKTAPAHLEFWSNRHAELHGLQPNTSTETETENSESGDKKKAIKESSTPTQSYADLSKKCCYLCSRQFKTEAEVNKHERLSQLHRDNLKNEDLVSKAEAKMVRSCITHTNLAEDTSEYRDRAKERRAAFGASKKISLPLKKSATKPDKDTKEDLTPVPSKGASLLGKMGWSSGEGLGAQGTGMTAPIVTDMYVQGVGLGAQGGKIGDAAEEAERNTKGGYGEFLERTKDKAKERFERMV